MTDKMTYGARPLKTGDKEKDTDLLLSANAVLREREETFRKLLDLSPDAVVVLQDGKYRFASRAFTTMFGYAQEDIDRGLSFLELVRAEDRDAVRQRYEDRLAGRPVPRTFQIDLIAKDGTLIPCETSANRVIFNGRPADLVFIRDISERLVAADALQSKEQTLRVLLNSTHDLALLLDTQGTVLTCNKSLAGVFGKTPEELKGADIYSILPPEVQKLRKGKAAEVIRTRQPVRYTEERNGHCFDCNLFPITDEEGQVTAFTVFVKDITDQRRNEKALHTVREELEQRVRERTRELEEKAHNLEEVNTALKVLLKRLDEDKKAVEEKILFNLRQLIEPVLEKLKTGRLTERQKNLMDTLESNLAEITSPFARRFSDSFMKLTPTEIQVANFIRQGKTTKEIAEMLNLSPKTIEFHRDNIRTKIGIKNKKINLRTHLLSI
ncbi:MAG: PAS domain S-box protein [Desulfobacterales bacterium]|jgi:PAS domain S-box-containing protein